MYHETGHPTSNLESRPMDGRTSAAATKRGMSLKVLVRTAITFFPQSKQIKVALQDRLNRLRGRAHDEDYEAFRQMGLAPDLLILDIGANHGQSITSFKTLFPDCRIVSFEPSRILADRLGARHADDPKVTVHGCARSRASSPSSRPTTAATASMRWHPASGTRRRPGSARTRSSTSAGTS